MDVIPAVLIRNHAKEKKYGIARCFLLRAFFGGLDELCMPNMPAK